MRARVAIRSQWKNLLIENFPSLAPGKLFTEEGRREISSLTTIFVAESLLERWVLYSAKLSLESDLPGQQTGLTKTLLSDSDSSQSATSFKPDYAGEGSGASPVTGQLVEL